MERHLHHELESLRKELFKMKTQTVESLVGAIKAVKNKDLELANKIIENDTVVNKLELKVDNQILSILALQQPVAIDFRFLTAALKINNDLERVADKSVKIAKTVEYLINYNIDKAQMDHLIKMADFSINMIKNAFDCFMNKKADKAKKIIEADIELDRMNDTAINDVLSLMEKDNYKTAEFGLNLYKVATSLERVGDLATNISEDVIYYACGKTVRHGGL